jgi:hypothetical protein
MVLTHALFKPSMPYTTTPFCCTPALTLEIRKLWANTLCDLMKEGVIIIDPKIMVVG